MSLMSTIRNTLTKVQDNSLELFTTFCLFIGLPLVAGLYLDYRAALLTFFVTGVVVGTLAMRRVS
jgi:hypothetical protein